MNDVTYQDTALAGLKVLDLSRVLAGPSATQMLGDLGADIVKVERPDGGDDTRRWGPPFVKNELGGSVETAYFASCNRNKRSVTLDFKSAEDLKSLQSLARRADILVENFKPGGLARYGLDYQSLSAINPRLIYCSITGFGQTGPYAHRPGYDFLMQGMGGLMSITGHAPGVEGDEPMKVGVAICDLFTGLNAVTAILAALQFRHRTGEGQHIDCALLDSQAAMLANQASNWLNSGVTPQRMGNHHPSIVPYQVFAAQDGHVIINCGNDGQFERLCAALGDPALSSDVRFADNEARCAHRGELERIINMHLSTLRVAEAIPLFESVNVPCGPINDIPTMFDDPQVKARDVEVKLLREDGATFTSVAYPPQLSRSPARYHRAPPVLGAHNAEVFQDWGIVKDT